MEDLARLIVGSLAIGYLPGALFFRLPIGRREERAALSAAERVFWHVILSSAWSLTVMLVLASLDRYRFDRLLVANLAVSILMILIGRRKLLYQGPAVGASLG